MLRCSEEAFARCPSRELCGNIQDAMFMEGSDCDRFNRSVADQPMTNGDWIRSMGDEELAEFIGHARLCDRVQGDGDWCLEHAVCRGCIEEWLRKPYKEGKV